MGAPASPLEGRWGRIAGQRRSGDRGAWYRYASLHVIETNRRAVAFYTRHGWHMTKCSPHETLPVNRLTMGKALAPLN